MPVPWLVIFKAIPWGDVVVNAPKVLDQAKKLVATLRKQDGKLAAGTEPSTSGRPHPSLPAIEARLASAENKLEEMAREALSSAELARSLAEQNAQLVQAVEILGTRVRRLSVLVVALACVAAGIAMWQFA